MSAPDFSIEYEAPPAREPAWAWSDLGIFIGAVLPALAIATLLLKLGAMLAPQALKGQTARALIFQLFAYAILLAALYFIVVMRYGLTFWRGLGWLWPLSGAGRMVAFGPLLAIGLASLGVFLGIPAEPSKIEDLISTKTAFAAMAVFGVFLGPAFEELVFRGFLFPLVTRETGAVAGIILTSIPFGLLHGAQNNWSWQPIVLITVAGAIFGAVRWKTGSTAMSFLLHAAYNATQFGLYALTRWGGLQ